MLSTLLRWLALPIVLAAVAALGIVLAFGLVALADGRCVEMVGGACVEAWHSAAVEGAIQFSVAAVVLAMPILTAWIAPAAKRVLPVLVALLGAGLLWSLALMTGWRGTMTLALLATLAALAGAATALWSRRGATAQNGARP